MAGFNILQSVTDVYVDVCLNNVCSIKYKSHLMITAHKLLAVLRKFSYYNEAS